MILQQLHHLFGIALHHKQHGWNDEHSASLEELPLEIVDDFLGIQKGFDHHDLRGVIGRVYRDQVCIPILDGTESFLFRQFINQVNITIGALSESGSVFSAAVRAKHFVFLACYLVFRFRLLGKLQPKDQCPKSKGNR